MTVYEFLCPECGAKVTQSSNEAPLCPYGLEQPIRMRRVYTAPGLTSAAVPTRYSKGTR